MSNPTFTNGKICYIEIPSSNIETSSGFYQTIFGWDIRKRGDGSVSFTDTAGHVSGVWILGNQAATHPEILIYIMVDNAAAILDLVIKNGGSIVTDIDKNAKEITAKFSDPSGNVFGIYQQKVNSE
jgi:uncharacterized protein